MTCDHQSVLFILRNYMTGNQKFSCNAIISDLSNIDVHNNCMTLTFLRNVVCYIISNGYVNNPVMFILFIINTISYSNKEPCRSPSLDQETF